MIDEPFEVMVRRCMVFFGMERWRAEDHVRTFVEARDRMRSNARIKRDKKQARPWDNLAFRPDLQRRLRSAA